MVEATFPERILLLGEGQRTVQTPTLAKGKGCASASLSVNLMIEEPGASIAHARICGGPGRAIAQFTRPNDNLRIRRVMHGFFCRRSEPAGLQNDVLVGAMMHRSESNF